MKVAVLMGGKSFEREVSLASGKVVCEALEEAGHKVVPLDTNADLVPTLRSERPDVVYNALHGKHGEDGTIQSLLEFLGIPFVGSPASVCHRAWNKDALHSSLAKYRDLTGEEGCASWPQGVYLARDAFKGMGAATALDMVADRVIGDVLEDGLAALIEELWFDGPKAVPSGRDLGSAWDAMEKAGVAE